MFRERDPQGRFDQDASIFLPEKKAKRLLDSWAEHFRQHCLGLIDESRFSEMYHATTGRPNRPVQTVLGVLLLKEMFNLTDTQALEQLEFNLLWQHALALSPEEAHLAQKTLHNFRTALMEHDLARVAFQDTADRIIAALGINTSKQRLDSTHIISNIALLTRLGLFCETIRVFLRAVASGHPRLHSRIPAGLLARYFRESGPTCYEDAPSKDARRRLPVCARDLYRLVDLFRGTVAENLDEYGLIKRLLEEQCVIVDEPDAPADDDDDVDDGGVPVQLKEPKKIASDSLQSPHDPDATYNAHKGKGYELQVSETCHGDNVVQVLTHVELTASSDSDAHQLVPAVKRLKERDIQPTELVADTSYGSAENSLEAERLGTEIVSPVGGSVKPTNDHDEAVAGEADYTPADFRVDPTDNEPTVCPEGQEATTEFENGDKNKAVAFFDEAVCGACPSRGRCPVKRHRVAGAGYYLAIDLKAVNLERRRRVEATGEFRSRYAIRAGSEATNSELKRRHGLGNIRVRGRPRVELAAYLKAAACNFKRMIAHLMGGVRDQTAAVPC